MSASERSSAASAPARAVRAPRSAGRWLLLVLLVAPLLVLAVVLGPLSRREQTGPELYAVGHGDIVLRCEFPATLVSDNVAEINCEVAAQPGPEGESVRAELLWVASNGQLVKAGDLLAEFDATSLRDSRDDWQLKSIRSEGILEQISLRYRNEQSRRATQLANAAERLGLIRASEETGESMQAEIGILLRAIDQARQGAKSADLNDYYLQALERLGVSAQPIAGRAPELPGQQTAESSLIDAVDRFAELSGTGDTRPPQRAFAVLQMYRGLVHSQGEYESRIEKLRAEQKVARGALEQQRQRSAYYEKQLANCRIPAPIDGVVEHVAQDTEDRGIEAGMLLREGQKLLVVHDLSQMSLVASVDGPAARYLSRGMPASIRFRVGRRASVEGEITEVEQRADVAEVAVTPAAPSPYPPGTSADVAVVARRCEDVLRIPVTALHRWNDQVYCFVPSDAGLEQRPLSIGVMGRRYAEVLDGLTLGDTVVREAAAVAEGMFGN